DALQPGLVRRRDSRRVRATGDGGARGGRDGREGLAMDLSCCRRVRLSRRLGAHHASRNEAAGRPSYAAGGSPTLRKRYPRRCISGNVTSRTGTVTITLKLIDAANAPLS